MSCIVNIEFLKLKMLFYFWKFKNNYIKKSIIKDYNGAFIMAK